MTRMEKTASMQQGCHKKLHSLATSATREPGDSNLRSILLKAYEDDIAIQVTTMQSK